MTAVVPVLPPEIAAAAGRGWHVFPVKAGQKAPPLLSDWSGKASRSLDQIEAWARLYRDCNWALACGPDSKVYVLDIDGPDGKASVEAWARRGWNLPVTRTHKTPRGQHLLFNWPEGFAVTISAGKLGTGLDERGKNGYILLPPSLHPSGHHYVCEDEAVPLADMPQWLIDLHQRPVQPARVSSQPATSIGCGKRTPLLFKLAGKLRAEGVPPEGILAALQGLNATFDPPHDEEKVRKIARDVERYPAGGQPTVPEVPIVPPLPPMPLEDAARITEELLETCRAWIRRYIVVSDEQAVIMAAWVLHTYVFNAFEVTPYLFVSSPEKGSGKSTLLRILKAVAYRGRYSSGMSGAALARVVEASRPTLFLDELDAQMKGNKETAENIRGILNSGYEPEGAYTRCVGKDFAVKDFPTFCPKCLAGIGELWDTVSDRSITIEMRRMLSGETIEPDRHVAVKAAATPIKARSEEWAARGAADLLRSIHPAPISGFNPRQNDIAEVLLAIAQLAGGEWPQRLTQALTAVFKATGAGDTSTGVTLLADIRGVFDERSADTVPSAVLAEHLCEIEGRPWAEWSHGKALTTNSLARQLKKFKVYPGKIRLGPTETAQGYRRRDFEDAWSRYCPIPPFQTGTTEHPASLLADSAFSIRNTLSPVPVANSASNPHEQRRVPVVPLQDGGRGDSEVAWL
ncbi:MAG: DUF3631 domain-containing protein [Terracidiphilus sp.]|jgi:hypothetical protein